MRGVFYYCCLVWKVFVAQIRLSACLIKDSTDIRCIKMKFNADFIVSASVVRKQFLNFFIVYNGAVFTNKPFIYLYYG